MSKLLQAFLANPSLANRAKLQTYLNRHMMAACLATPEETAALRTNNFTL